MKHLGGDGEREDATTGEAPIGSPPYMSPEQLTRPADVDQRTDIWSLGVCLYENLGGKAPFAAAGFGELCAQILQQEPPALDAARPELDARLVALVARCLRKERAERYGSIRELVHELAPHGSERARRSLAVIEAISAPGVEVPGANEPGATERPEMDTGTLTAATESPAPRSTATPAPRSNRAWLVAALALAAAAAVVRFATAPRTETDRPGSPVTEGKTTPSANQALEPSGDAPRAAEMPSAARSAAALAGALGAAPSAAASAPPSRRSKVVGAGLAPPRSSSAAPARSFDPVYEDRN